MDGYCERVGPGLWAEPANAVTNLAFLLAAALLVWRIRRPAPASAWLLPALLAVVGLCSLSYHTFATPFTGALDSLSIVVFVLTAVVVYLHWMWGVSWRWAWLGAPAFLLFIVVVDVGLVVLGGRSAALGGYVPALVGLAGMGLAVGRTARPGARFAGAWLLVATAVFVVSLTLRTIDRSVCASWPLGTHFLWHCLNAVVLYLVAAPVVRVSADPV